VKFLYNELESEEVSYVGCNAVSDLAANHPGSFYYYFSVFDIFIIDYSSVMLCFLTLLFFIEISFSELLLL
jgi:CDP-glycerol glycerophosphotransferase (TagB/SpsB family)